MACGRCGNNNRGTGAPTVVTSGRPGGNTPRPGTPTVVSSGKPTVRSPLRDTISGLRYVPNSDR